MMKVTLFPILPKKYEKFVIYNFINKKYDKIEITT